jgi:hypothetical protein
MEIGNGLLMAERRRRITPEGVAQALSLIDGLPLEAIPPASSLPSAGEQFWPPLTRNC